jgi:hypothetical protein
MMRAMGANEPHSLALFFLAMLSLGITACSSAHIDREGGFVTMVDSDDPAGAFTIERGVIEQALKHGPAWFIAQVAVDPVVVRGTFYGFRVLSLFPDHSEFNDTSIQRGDIVQRVNGMPIERPEQFMVAWSSLRSMRHLTIRVIRNGQPLQLTWRIRESSDTMDSQARFEGNESVVYRP